MSNQKSKEKILRRMKDFSGWSDIWYEHPTCLTNIFFLEKVGSFKASISDRLLFKRILEPIFPSMEREREMFGK